MIVDWTKSFESLQREFEDVKRSYPKIFFSRLIAPPTVGSIDDWRFIYGNKHYVQHILCHIDSEYSDQYCLYADIHSDKDMCKHALQQFEALSHRTVQTIMEIPLEVREFLNFPEKERKRGETFWLEMIDTLASRPNADDQQVTRFERNQVKVLRSDSDTPILMPAMLYKENPNSLPSEAFPHLWLSEVSPDIMTCSIGAIEKIMRILPDPEYYFSVITWIDKNGDNVTWTFYDPDVVAELQDTWGEPIKKYEHQGHGVSGAVLIRRLDKIPPGPADAHAYHELIAQMLNQLFSPDLAGMKIEQKINEGRKRIDICFDNVAQSGFFHDLKITYQIKCPLVVVECKNYSNDPGNPELDQLIARFGQQRGYFGILICREINDRKTIISRCRDFVHAQQGHIIVLDDSDIKSLWHFHAANKKTDFYQFLRDKMKELIL